MDRSGQPPHAPLVIDPRLAAPRGAAYSAGALNDEGQLEDVPVHFYPEGEGTAAASTTTAIDASNKGFQLLQKMGWKGKGLGRQEDGIAEPVKTGVEAGVRLGLGKQQEDDKYTDADSITRKKLEVEIQADEDPDRTKRREAAAQREHAIKQDVTQILQTFYCQVCNKQYTSAMELEEHLSSYDHHHKKRLAEARASELERTRDERQRKEQKRQQREQQRLEEQIRKAQAAANKQQSTQDQPPPPPPPPPDDDTLATAGARDGAVGGWSAVGHSAAVDGGGPADTTAASGGWSSSTSVPPAAAWAAPHTVHNPSATATEAVLSLPYKQAQAAAPISSSSISFGLKVAAGAGRGGSRGGDVVRGPGLAGSKRPAAAMQAVDGSRHMQSSQVPAAAVAASSGGAAGLQFRPADGGNKGGATSRLCFTPAGMPNSGLSGPSRVASQGPTSNPTAQGFTTGGSSTGGLGFKPDVGTGGGLGFKTGRGAEKSKPVSAAFGESSDEEP